MFGKSGRISFQSWLYQLGDLQAIHSRITAYINDSLQHFGAKTFNLQFTGLKLDKPDGTPTLLGHSVPQDSSFDLVLPDTMDFVWLSFSIIPWRRRSPSHRSWKFERGFETIPWSKIMRRRSYGTIGRVVISDDWLEAAHNGDTGIRALYLPSNRDKISEQMDVPYPSIL